MMVDKFVWIIKAWKLAGSVVALVAQFGMLYHQHRAKWVHFSKSEKACEMSVYLLKYLIRLSAGGTSWLSLVSPSSSRLGLPLSNPVIGCDQPYPGSQDRCNSYVPCRQSAVGSPCQRPHTYTIVILWSFNSIVVGWVLDNSLSKSRLDVGRGGCRVTVRS